MRKLFEMNYNHGDLLSLASLVDRLCFDLCKSQKKKPNKMKKKTIYICIIVYRHHVTITYLIQAIHAKLKNNTPIHINQPNNQHVIQTTHTVAQNVPLIHQPLNVKAQLDQAVTTIQPIVHHHLAHVPAIIHTAQLLQAVCHMAQLIAIFHTVFKQIKTR